MFNKICAANNMFSPIIYADDLTLTSIVSVFSINNNTNDNNKEKIHSALNLINDWLKLDNFSWHVSNSTCMVFRNTQK